MNKLLIISLSAFLFLLLAGAGAVLFTFTPTGNDMLKPYIKKALERKTGLPVEVKAFKLESGTSDLDVLIDKQVMLRVRTNYRLWGQSFEGIYHLKTNSFVHKEVHLRQADIKGTFKGVAEDIYLDGNGTALDAKVDYRLKIIDDLAQKIEVRMKGVQLSEVLGLWGQPALAEGKIDVAIKMPDMEEDRAKGYGHIILKKAYFNRQLVEKLYDYSLPEQSYVNGMIDADLEGKNVKLIGNVQSNLFMLQIKDALLHTASKQVTAEYVLDVQDMRILTKNKLAGALKAEGKVQIKDKKVLVTGKSNSLGGALRFSVDQIVKLNFDGLSLEKLLPLLKQPDYAKGELSGTVLLDDLKAHSGSYALHVDKGILKPKAIEKMSRYHIPQNNVFTLESKGSIVNKKLAANASIHSTLADVTFSSLKYDIEQKSLLSNYDLLIHDVNAFIPKVQQAKGTAVKAKGELTFTDRLSISGVTKGLGEKVAFSYDSKSARVEASALFVEKILALAGLPVYTKGTMDTKVVLRDLNPAEGTFFLKSTKLVTQPEEMKKVLGKDLRLNVTLESSGMFKKGIGYADTEVKTSLGDITLNDIVYDIQQNQYKSAYTLDIPELKKLHDVIDKKLYGPLVLKGQLHKEKILKANGDTQSLGGNISYTLVGNTLNSKIDSVPLINILGTLGHKKNFLGQASGEGVYHLKQKTGVVDLDIASFQIKPSTLTDTLKMFIGKDPARVIFSSTKFHADIQGKITDYTLHAKGSSSSIEITEGRINKINNTNTAKFKFVYEKYTVNGQIKGSVDDPKVTVDTTALFKDKLNDKYKEKIEKALGGKAGEFLKKLSF